MLTQERNREYVVVPPWAAPDLWARLRGPVVDPHHSGLLRQDFDYGAAGYDLVQGHVEFAAGPRGGGIVIIQKEPALRSLASVVLRCFGQLVGPSGMTGLGATFPTSVGYLKLQGDSDKLENETAIGPIHVEAAEDRLFWMVGLAREQTREVDGAIQQLAAGFDFDVAPLDHANEEWQIILQSACSKNPPPFRWYSVESAGFAAGWHLAVAVYIYLALNTAVGGPVKLFHVIGEIEGQPRPRKFSKLPPI